MHITCEHCGSTIDLDKDKVCPNCGAPYNNNKEFKSVKEYHQKNKEMNLKEREMKLEHQKEVQETAKKVATGVFAGQAVIFAISGIVFLLIIGGFVFGISRNINRNAGKNEIITGNYNEYAVGKLYEMKCDGIEKIDNSKYNFHDNEKIYYKFHILFKNKSEDWISLNDIQLTYTDENGNEDIKANKPHLSISYDELDYFAKEKMTYSGEVIFEIPEYVKDVKLRLNNITINIDNFKSLIK